eukprot:PhF_6_TR2278/c0_g1_i2/m.3950
MYSKTTYNREYQFQEAFVRIQQGIEKREKDVRHTNHHATRAPWEEVVGSVAKPLSVYLQDYTPSAQEQVRLQREFLCGKLTESAYLKKRIERRTADALDACNTSNNAVSHIHIVQQQNSSRSVTPIVANSTIKIPPPLRSTSTPLVQPTPPSMETVNTKQSSSSSTHEKIVQRANSVLSKAVGYLRRTDQGVMDLGEIVKITQDELAALEMDRPMTTSGVEEGVEDQPQAVLESSHQQLQAPIEEQTPEPVMSLMPPSTPALPTYPCYQSLKAIKQANDRQKSEIAAISVSQMREVMNKNAWYLRNSAPLEPIKHIPANKLLEMASLPNGERPPVVDPHKHHADQFQVILEEQRAKIAASMVDPKQQQSSTINPAIQFGRKKAFSQRHVCAPTPEFKPELPWATHGGALLMDDPPAVHLAVHDNNNKGVNNRVWNDMMIAERRRVDVELRNVRDTGALRRKGGSRFVSPEGNLLPPPTMLVTTNPHTTSLHQTSTAGAQPMTPAMLK